VSWREKRVPMLRSLYLSSAPPRPAIRIGLLVDSALASIVEDLVTCNLVSLDLVIYNAEGALQRPCRASLPIRLLRLLGSPEWTRWR
jgi:hypothetical protein